MLEEGRKTMPEVLADEGVSSISTITDTLTSSFSTMVSDCFTMIATLVPIVLPLLGASVVVAYGIKTFRKITAKA